MREADSPDQSPLTPGAPSVPLSHVVDSAPVDLSLVRHTDAEKDSDPPIRRASVLKASTALVDIGDDEIAVVAAESSGGDALVEAVRGGAHAAALVVVGVGPPAPSEALATACRETGRTLMTAEWKGSTSEFVDQLNLLIMERRMDMLQASLVAIDAFTRLSVEGATARQIVDEVSTRCGCPVVFENLMHQVLAFSVKDAHFAEVLDDWEARSRLAPVGRWFVDEGASTGWFALPVELREQRWGRMVLLPAEPPTDVQVIIAERAARALALNRLLEHNRATLERQAHGSTLTDIISHRFRTAHEMHVRLESLGMETRGRALTMILLEAKPQADTAGDVIVDRSDSVAATLSAAGISALVATMFHGRLGVLLAFARSADRKAVLTSVAERLRAEVDWDGVPVVIGAGSTVRRLEEVARSFDEAAQVLDAASGGETTKPYFELPDVQLRGLLHALAEDSRLQSFTERSLGVLVDYDNRYGAALVDTLRIFLSHGGNKASAAESAFVSRQTFYRRLAMIEKISRRDLSSPDVRTSLHVAVMALDAQRDRRR